VREEVHVWRAAERGTGREALREILSRYLGEEPAAISLRLAEGGKPELAEPGSELRFNLSHSGELALVAVALGREVGVDVERIDRRRDVLKLAERWLGADAAAAVRAAPAQERIEVFYAAWTRHEALVKCIGTSVFAHFAATSISTASLPIDRGYAAALAVDGADSAAHRCFTLAPAEH
jgi:4'-phosphopantetheinyl transferase